MPLGAMAHRIRLNITQTGKAAAHCGFDSMGGVRPRDHDVAALGLCRCCQSDSTDSRNHCERKRLEHTLPFTECSGTNGPEQGKSADRHRRCSVGHAHHRTGGTGSRQPRLGHHRPRQPQGRHVRSVVLPRCWFDAEWATFLTKPSHPRRKSSQFRVVEGLKRISFRLGQAGAGEWSWGPWTLLRRLGRRPSGECRHQGWARRWWKGDPAAHPRGTPTRSEVPRIGDHVN